VNARVVGLVLVVVVVLVGCGSGGDFSMPHPTAPPPLGTSSNPTEAPPVADPVPVEAGGLSLSEQQDSDLMLSFPSLPLDTRVGLCVGFLSDPVGFVDQAMVQFGKDPVSSSITRSGARTVYEARCSAWLDDPAFTALDRAIWQGVWESRSAADRVLVCENFRADPFGSTEGAYADSETMTPADARGVYGEVCR
jgi:hypothetical protein